MEGRDAMGHELQASWPLGGLGCPLYEVEAVEDLRTGQTARDSGFLAWHCCHWSWMLVCPGASLGTGRGLVVASPTRCR